MIVTVPNSTEPKCGNRSPFAEFTLTLKRMDGMDGMIELEVKKPKCFRDFHQFTGAEKDAYWAIVNHVVETASAALHEAIREAHNAKH